MKKATHHISHILKSGVLLLILYVSLTSIAQDTGSLAKSIDTLIEVMEAEEMEINRKPELITDEERLPVIQRSIDTNKVSQLKDKEEFWYVDEVPTRKSNQSQASRKPSLNLQNQTWLRNLLWTLVVGGGISILIWFMASSDIKLFRRSSPVEDKLVNEEGLSTDNLFDFDFDTSLKKAIAAQNYRQGIRLLYLQTLKELTMKNLIQYKLERTNNDYLIQLYSTPYYKEFFSLTRSFEFAWYGQFTVSPDSFDIIRKEFSAFKKQITG